GDLLLHQNYFPKRYLVYPLGTRSIKQL
ncbi:MAG: hypothetical protein JWM42_150, partial [Burkholderia sp.]|nr:hypothetical protein [Burkholderia sp.]